MRKIKRNKMITLDINNGSKIKVKVRKSTNNRFKLSLLNNNHKTVIVLNCHAKDYYKVLKQLKDINNGVEEVIEETIEPEVEENFESIEKDEKLKSMLEETAELLKDIVMQQLEKEKTEEETIEENEETIEDEVEEETIEEGKFKKLFNKAKEVVIGTITILATTAIQPFKAIGKLFKKFTNR